MSRPTLESRSQRPALDWPRHLFYWFLPGLLVSIYIAMYFSGIPGLRDLVAPPRNREFGLLENSQNLIILATAFVALAGYRRTMAESRRYLFLLAFLGCLFLVLEENDYGLTYWELLYGHRQSGPDSLRNLHNIGDTTHHLKRFADVVAIAGFVILPFLASRVPAGFAYFVPHRYSALTVLCGILLVRLAHLLDDAGLYPGGPLSTNISEFREFFTYYLWLIWFVELTYIRLCGGSKGSARG